MLLLQPLLTKESVNVDKTKVDGEATPLVEDDERVGAVVYMLRNGLGQIKPIRKGDLRIYRSVTGRGELEKRMNEVVLGVAFVWLLCILLGVIIQAVISEYDR